MSSKSEPDDLEKFFEYSITSFEIPSLLSEDFPMIPNRTKIVNELKTRSEARIKNSINENSLISDNEFDHDSNEALHVMQDLIEILKN